MSDEEIKAVLKRAAEDRAFFDALMARREATLDACQLSPAEKAILMAPTDEQLGKMVAQARKRPWSSLARVGFFVGGVAAAVGLTGLLAAPLLTTMGITAEDPGLAAAYVPLYEIVNAEGLYRAEHGSYASLEELLRHGTISLPADSHYVFEIEVDGDTFTATARHRTRPRTRRAFQVGPDGEVRPLK